MYFSLRLHARQNAVRERVPHALHVRVAHDKVFTPPQSSEKIVLIEPICVVLGE